MERISEVRPPYTLEFYKIIYDFHAKGSGVRDEAWDAGTGIGNVAVELASSGFKHIWATDPSQSHIGKAHKYIDAAGCKEKITTKVAKAEDGIDAPDGSIDLVTVAEALHWTDWQKVVKAAALKVKPGGTFAAWIYGVHCFFVDPAYAQAQGAYDQIFLEWVRLLFKKMTQTASGSCMQSRFDCVEFESKDWKDVHRIHWASDHTTTGPGSVAHIDSRVGPDDTVERHTGIGTMVVHANVDWMAGFLDNLYPDLKMSDICSDEFARLRDLMGGKEAKLQVAWPHTLVMARRK